jgi:choline-phosphate cytidylyltransferase/glycerol-3-phosphate cytidylyltransferase
MYQIFTDRFYRGDADKERNIPIRDDVIVNEDWDNGIPQFAQRNGEPLKNNMFFGGTLWGVIEKLDYLKELGVDVVYFPYGKGVCSSELKHRIYERYEQMTQKADSHFSNNTNVRNP